MEQGTRDMKALVIASAHGEAASCKELYECLVDKVYAYVRYRTATDEVATDITQDVFIDFFTALPNFTYQSHAQLYAYLFTITRRKLAAHYHDRAKRGEGTQVAFDEETMSPLADAEASASGDIQRALNTLDEEAQEIVILHHWSRYTFGEIAELLHKKESAVRVRHHRALKALAAALNR